MRYTQSSPFTTPNVQTWRETILHGVLSAMVAFGAIALLSNAVALTFLDREQALISPALRLSVHAVSYAIVVAITVHRSLPFLVRAGTPLVLLTAIGLLDIYLFGLHGDAELFFFAVIALATLFFRLEVGIRVLVALCSVMLAVAITPHIAWLILPFEQTVRQSSLLLDNVLIFFFLVIIVIIPTHYLLSSLEQSLMSTADHAHTAEAAAHRSAQQAEELAAQKAQLEQVEHELRKTVAQTERRMAHIQALRQIDLAITMNRDVYQTLDITLAQVMTQLQVDAAAIWLYNEVSQTLDYTIGYGIPGTDQQAPQAIIDASAPAYAARERQMITIPATHQAAPCSSPVLQAYPELVTAYSIPLIARDRVKGVLEVFHRQPVAPDPEWLNFGQILARQAAIAIDHAELLAKLECSNDELTLAYDSTLGALVRALELRDAETEGHCRRVTTLAVKLAQAIGMSPDEIEHIRRGAILHDIGKMAIPDSILLKPGPLTDDEYVLMQQHTTYAYEMLAPISFLQPALDIPYCHHEKWDGTGYPRQLKQDDIPLMARLFAVIDVYDALCSDRPYRNRWPEDRVRAYLADQAGTHFDPAMVDVFVTEVLPTVECT